MDLCWLMYQVYFNSLQFGPEHESTSGGYYQMGNVFLALNQHDNALAMYEKVVEIWYTTLNQAIKTLEQTNVELIGKHLQQIYVNINR